MLIPGADPLRKVTIIPRGVSLGVTLSSPDTDRFNYTDRELNARIRALLAGRAAEQIVFGELTSGAESDLDQLTTIARYMVGRWGMSTSVGMMSALDGESRGNASPETLALLDVEVRKIAEEAYADIVSLLRDERQRLDALASALLVHETLDAEDGYAAVGLMALATGWIAAGAGLRPAPFFLGLAVCGGGLGASALLVRETRGHVQHEVAASSIPTGSRSWRQVFLHTTLREPSLSAACQAGLVNNANDALAWGLLPLFWANAGLQIGEIVLKLGGCEGGFFRRHAHSIAVAGKKHQLLKRIDRLELAQPCDRNFCATATAMARIDLNSRDRNSPR